VNVSANKNFVAGVTAARTASRSPSSTNVSVAPARFADHSKNVFVLL
jgi:hypothetical protein